ncbi:MAG: peptidoglycan-binding protein [Frankia sp.]|nr:peptidoglycan-binding protein [Frankia sp.]
MQETGTQETGGLAVGARETGTRKTAAQETDVQETGTRPTGERGAGVARRRRRTRRMAVAAVVVLLLAAVIVAGAIGFDTGGEESDGSGEDGGLPPATEQVIRQTLVDRQTRNGELGYGYPVTVADRLGGTLTALPAAGTVVNRGEALYRVDDAPIVLLYGALPAYRALTPGTTGADVAQFEQNLRDLGYQGFTVDDSYTSGTAAAVRAWQKNLGLPQTGTVDLGRVVYALGPVRVNTLSASVGDVLQPGSSVLTFTGMSRVVTLELEVSDHRLAAEGTAVDVALPNGRKVTGKVADTRTVIDTGGSGGESDEPTTKIQTTVTVDDEQALAEFDQASVTVSFVASQRENVLTVPVAALLALAEGGYGVEVVEGTATRIVPVETGLFADGRVEVSGDGLTEGMTVGMPS